MINTNVDLGQLLIVGMLGCIAWFIKKEINNLTTRLDKHDGILFQLVGDVQRLIGATSGRRRYYTNKDQE